MIAVGLSGCETEIYPIAPTEMAYSIYGYLDALADTQWIRVAPFRTTIFSTPDLIDAEVTIEDLGTGRFIDLNAGLFRQGSPNFGDTLFAYNFWTDEGLDYGATYRLTAQRSDGSLSSSVVKIPLDHSHIPIIVGKRQPRTTVPNPDFVRFHLLPGTHVAMVHTRRYAKGDSSCRKARYNTLPPHPPPETGGDVQMSILSPESPDCLWDQTDIGIVRATEAWPFLGINDYTNVLALTNIQNGVGYFSGFTITSVPLEECTLVGPGAPGFCELYYAPDTAVLFVRPINVSGFPDEYPVEDPENYPFTAGPTLRRGEETWSRRPGSSETTADPNAPGIARFPGLRPGRYQLRVDGFIGSFPLYCEERVLDLAPGDTSIDIRMTMPEIDPNEPVNSDGCREG